MNKVTFHRQDGSMFDAAHDLKTFARLFAQNIFYFRVGENMYRPGSSEGRFAAQTALIS